MSMPHLAVGVVILSLKTDTRIYQHVLDRHPMSRGIILPQVETEAQLKHLYQSTRAHGDCPVVIIVPLATNDAALAKFKRTYHDAVVCRPPSAQGFLNLMRDVHSRLAVVLSLGVPMAPYRDMIKGAKLLDIRSSLATREQLAEAYDYFRRCQRRVVLVIVPYGTTVGELQRLGTLLPEPIIQHPPQLDYFRGTARLLHKSHKQWLYEEAERRQKEAATAAVNGRRTSRPRRSRSNRLRHQDKRIWRDRVKFLFQPGRHDWPDGVPLALKHAAAAPGRRQFNINACPEGQLRTHVTELSASDQAAYLGMLITRGQPLPSPHTATSRPFGS
jgi:hypothetical protein